MKYKTLKLSDIKKKPSECSCGTADYHLVTCPQVTTTNKKLEEIPSITFDLAEVMHRWYKCECDGNRIYYANKAGKFFQKKLNSLLQEIEEKVIGEDEWTKKERGAMEPLYSNKNLLRNKLRRQQRKALKTIKERYL